MLGYRFRRVQGRHVSCVRAHFAGNLLLYLLSQIWFSPLRGFFEDTKNICFLKAAICASAGVGPAHRREVCQLALRAYRQLGAFQLWLSLTRGFKWLSKGCSEPSPSCLTQAMSRRWSRLTQDFSLAYLLVTLIACCLLGAVQQDALHHLHRGCKIQDGGRAS